MKKTGGRPKGASARSRISASTSFLTTTASREIASSSSSRASPRADHRFVGHPRSQGRDARRRRRGCARSFTTRSSPATSTIKRSKTASAADIIVGWAELADWWKFWRGGKHTKYSIQRALETAYDLELFDARWFFDMLESGGGKLHGTDVLVEGMSKTELADWIKKIHESGDGSPEGPARLRSAGRRSSPRRRTPCLLSAIDAFAQKNGLVKDKFKADEGDEPRQRRLDQARRRRLRVSASPPKSARQSVCRRGPRGSNARGRRRRSPSARRRRAFAARRRAAQGARGAVAPEGDWLENRGQRAGERSGRRSRRRDRRGRSRRPARSRPRSRRSSSAKTISSRQRRASPRPRAARQRPRWSQQSDAARRSLRPKRRRQDRAAAAAGGRSAAAQSQSADVDARSTRGRAPSMSWARADARL